MRGRQQILLIESDQNLQHSLHRMLECEQFWPVPANDVNAASRNAALHTVELILLNPGPAGPEVCNEFRAKGVEAQIVVLSGLSGEDNIVPWLEAGADDYIVKPFSARELLARVRALLRRKNLSERNVRRFANITVDLTRRVVTKRDDELKLTPVEFNLLACFVQNPDRVLSRSFLLSLVWGYEDSSRTRTVDNHIGRLRQKLEDDAGQPQHLITEHGIGYRFLP